jgi:hypothetical protein
MGAQVDLLPGQEPEKQGMTPSGTCQQALLNIIKMQPADILRSIFHPCVNHVSGMCASLGKGPV